MNPELKAYLRLEATVAAAFNFFINGMISALIYHKADWVPADALSITIDLTLTCLFTFTVSAFFNRASLRRTQTAGILHTCNRAVRLLSRLFRRPALFGVLIGAITAVLLLALVVPVLAVLDVEVLPFAVYITFKTLFCALLGGGVALLELYAGMCRAE